jgi:alpha-D-xyloside xylohydrolase
MSRGSVLLAAAVVAVGVWWPQQAEGAVLEPEKGALLAVGDGFLDLEPCAPNVVRVAFARYPEYFQRRSLSVAARRCEPVAFEVSRAPGEAILTTAVLEVRVDTTTGLVSFRDSKGGPILAEAGRNLSPALVQGEQTYHVQQTWAGREDESLYGLGQQQLGLVDIKGYDLDLWQHNATVVIPFLVSSRGYGIFWDNTSFTRFGDLREAEPIPADRLFDLSGKPGGLTGQYFAGSRFERLVATRVDPRIDIAISSKETRPNRLIHPALPDGEASVRWEGEVLSQQAGDYTFKAFSNNGIRLWVDGRLVMDHWRQGWLPWYDVARVHMLANTRYRVKLEWYKEQGMETVQLLWKTPSASRATSLWSEVGDGVDYTFVYGPKLDDVIAGYRRLTGRASLMPRWAFGLWQSRQRYETAQQSLDVVDGFRSRKIPFDNIVQDWFYWREKEWGSHEFDPARFPDPDGWIKAIHDRHARLMISVWGKFYPGTANFEAMQAQGFLYQPNLAEGLTDWVGPGYRYTFYDAFNAEAGRLFWDQVNGKLFSKGVDAWWMDATEPDLSPTPTLETQKTRVNPTALGSGSRMLNGYALHNSRSVYEGQRRQSPEQRVFILTRSGFAGQQRYAAATWSGDVSSTWTALRQQIPAGLGFSISGMPYWTMDIGGFAVPARFSRKDASAADVEEWRELNTRWFEFGTFVPMTRVHGEAPKREMWEMGGETHPAYQAELKFDRLRYRLLPYVYSLAGAVTHEDATFMRPLVMDFPDDVQARTVTDQYLFGPALLVSPVTTYKARARDVYLPAGADWYDFWTGKSFRGGQTLKTAAPYDAIPLHVRAGGILLLGPELQYTDEKPADPLTLVVYAGADGAATLYEDDGVSNGYEKGAWSRIPIEWSERAHTLRLGARQGSFPGMLAERTVEVVLVSGSKPVPFAFEMRPQKTVRYRGEAIEISFPAPRRR